MLLILQIFSITNCTVVISKLLTSAELSHSTSVAGNERLASMKQETYK